MFFLIYSKWDTVEGAVSRFLNIIVRHNEMAYGLCPYAFLYFFIVHKIM